MFIHAGMGQMGVTIAFIHPTIGFHCAIVVNVGKFDYWPYQPCMSARLTDQFMGEFCM